MCFVRNKWTEFTPTTEYLSAVKDLTSVTKLYQYSQKFKYIAEKGDHWKTPIEFMNDGGGDCEDFARFTLDVLHRILNVKGARFVIHSGYNKKLWDKKRMCHAITVFPYYSKLAVFSNKNFYTGIDSFEDAGKILFINGLKYQEVRNHLGEILEKKSQWFGTF